MGIRKRRSNRSGRGVMRSPGRPGVALHEDRRPFWAAIAAGLSSENAAADVGVSPAVGVRSFQEAGGIDDLARAVAQCRHLAMLGMEMVVANVARNYELTEAGTDDGAPCGSA